MPTPFGPRLIGEAEKTLNALLRRFLAGTDLAEPEWVTLRLAAQLDGTGGADGLTNAVSDRAHLLDAAALVTGLIKRGLLHDDGRLTSAGRELTAAVEATIATETAPIWDNFAVDDVAAATRVLNEVVTRARAVHSAMLAARHGARPTARGHRSSSSALRDGSTGDADLKLL
jgi:hypothetical protein